jgi:RimJ/RimL family protein N-acetyltransferase
MTTGLLLGQDTAVAAWTWREFGLTPMHVNNAVGLLVDRALVGAAIFHNYNGTNVELSYYGPETITAGVVKFLARTAIFELNVTRVTFHVRRTNRRLRRHLVRLGAKHEATLWQFYGPDRDHAAIQFVLFRPELMKLAGGSFARAMMH